MWFGTFFDDESEQIINSENACFDYSFNLNLNHKEIWLPIKVVTKPNFLVVKQRMLVPLVTISVTKLAWLCGRWSSPVLSHHL